MDPREATASNCRNRHMWRALPSAPQKWDTTERVPLRQQMRTLMPLFAMSVMAMASAREKTDQQRIRYAAIGDSYSIGEGASPNESWPAILTRHLNAQGLHVDLVANPSRTGWTTQQAIDRELPIFVDSEPNFATP